jgi:hypothetical protein
VSARRLIEMSSPNGRRGHFYEYRQHGEGVEWRPVSRRRSARISRGTACPRMSRGTRIWQRNGGGAVAQ